MNVRVGRLNKTAELQIVSDSEPVSPTSIQYV